MGVWSPISRPMATKSKSPASTIRPARRCGPCTTPRTSESSLEGAEENPEYVMSNAGAIAQLAANTQSGYSLDQKFYCDDAVFAADMEQVISRKWLVAGHVDRVRNKGDYFLFKVGDESIIIIRSDGSTIGAFYNVCRHRGSLICTKPEGRVVRLTCP